ncbi:hypothetical protein [Nitrososphaera sp.]|uniref:hypothetical protein n=1 Tax=Nitrososphaera sp. TaxID=1971748 RepID=UPI003174ECA8
MGRSASAGSGTVFNVPESAGARFAERVFFLLCNSCYWCASGMGGHAIKNCPACNRLLDPLQVEAGELFRFDYRQRRGVRLDFRRA